MTTKQKLELRELTEREKQDFNQIILGKMPDVHMMLGVIAIDLLDEEEKQGPISYQTLTKKIDPAYMPDIEPDRIDEFLTLLGLFQTWILKCMTYKNHDHIDDPSLNLRGMQTNLQTLMYTLMDHLCGLMAGYSSKKSRELNDLFKEIEENASAEYLMRYIMTAIEYTGFKRNGNDGEKHKIDVSHITYEEYIDWRSRKSHTGIEEAQALLDMSKPKKSERLNNQYTFSKIEEREEADNCYFLCNVESENLGWIDFYGSLCTLFGEPLYVNNNLENMFEYLLKAETGKGESIRFSVYFGQSGLAIASYREMNATDDIIELHKDAAAALIELVKNTKPSDYSYEGYYEDPSFIICCGIKNGERYYEEKQ